MMRNNVNTKCRFILFILNSTQPFDTIPIISIVFCSHFNSTCQRQFTCRCFQFLLICFWLLLNNMRCPRLCGYNTFIGISHILALLQGTMYIHHPFCQFHQACREYETPRVANPWPKDSTITFSNGRYHSIQAGLPGQKRRSVHGGRVTCELSQQSRLELFLSASPECLCSSLDMYAVFSSFDGSDRRVPLRGRMEAPCIRYGGGSE